MQNITTTKYLYIKNKFTALHICYIFSPNHNGTLMMALTLQVMTFSTLYNTAQLYIYIIRTVVYQ